MQAAAERHTSSLLSVRGFGSGTAAVSEVGIVCINSGDNAGISGFVNDSSSGFARMFEFKPQNIFSVTSNDLNDFPGAMAGHVDAMNSAHDINKSPSFRFSSSIYAVDTSQLLEVGTFSETAEIRTEADTCLLYTSPSPRDLSTARMPSSA